MSFKLLRRFEIWIALIFPILIVLYGSWWFLTNGIIVQDMLMLALFYFISLFGISIGAHRFLSHRSFKAHSFMESILLITASSAFQYSPLYWAAAHRKHHKFTDRPGDPHSPWEHETPFKSRFSGWCHSYFAWSFTFPFEKTLHAYAPDLNNNKLYLFFHKIHYIIGLTFILLPGFIEWWLINSPSGMLRGIFWGGVFRVFLLHNSIFILNSFIGHGLGSRLYNLNDKSKNNILIFPLVLGDCWHHNHHAAPASASFQAKWYHIDPLYYILLILEKLHLIWDLRPFKVSESISDTGP